MLTNEERLRALVGNIKNWSWDVFPKFEIEKEDADALMQHFQMSEKEAKIKAEQNPLQNHSAVSLNK